MTEIVKEIEMPFWQNPQCYVFTEHQRDDVWVYFDCRDDNREKLKNVLGKITFISCFEVHIKRGVKKYLPEEPLLRSSLDEVINSKKINKYIKDYQNFTNTIFPNNKAIRHFVVNSHDHQVSILALDYKFSLEEKNSSNAHIFRILLG